MLAVLTDWRMLVIRHICLSNKGHSNSIRGHFLFLLSVILLVLTTAYVWFGEETSADNLATGTTLLIYKYSLQKLTAMCATKLCLTCCFNRGKVQIVCLIYLSSYLFLPAVYQGSDGLHPVRGQWVQPRASEPAAGHQRQHAVRGEIRLGCDGELPEGWAARPAGAGPDSPHRYIGSHSVCVFRCPRLQGSRWLVKCLSLINSAICVWVWVNKNMSHWVQKKQRVHWFMMTDVKRSG